MCIRERRDATMAAAFKAGTCNRLKRCVTYKAREKLDSRSTVEQVEVGVPTPFSLPARVSNTAADILLNRGNSEVAKILIGDCYRHRLLHGSFE